jgi:hypothetical protein
MLSPNLGRRSEICVTGQGKVVRSWLQAARPAPHLAPRSEICAAVKSTRGLQESLEARVPPNGRSQICVLARPAEPAAILGKEVAELDAFRNMRGNQQLPFSAAFRDMRGARSWRALSRGHRRFSLRVPAATFRNMRGFRTWQTQMAWRHARSNLGPNSPRLARQGTSAARPDDRPHAFRDMRAVASAAPCSKKCAKRCAGPGAWERSSAMDTKSSSTW